MLVCSVGPAAAPTAAVTVTKNFVINMVKIIFVSNMQEIETNCISRQIVFAIIIQGVKGVKVANASAIMRLNHE